MSEEERADTPLPWYEKKTLLIAWLMTFFPVGLYALWKGSVFERNWKIGITVVIAVLFIAGINFTNPIYVFLLYPGGVFLLWQDKTIARKTVYIFAGCWIPVFLLFATQYGGGASGGGYNDGGTCSAVMTQGNCTYYRDSNCNVIARECR